MKRFSQRAILPLSHSIFLLLFFQMRKCNWITQLSKDERTIILRMSIYGVKLRFIFFTHNENAYLQAIFLRFNDLVLFNCLRFEQSESLDH